MSLFPNFRRRTPETAAGASNEARLQDAMTTAPVGIARVALNGRWLSFNDATATILGYTRAELTRMRLHDLTHRDDATRELALIQEMLAGRARSYRITKRIADKNGGTRVIHLTAIVIRGIDADSDGFLYVIEAAEWRAEIDPLNHRVAAEVIDHLSWTAIVWTDAEGVITGWNAGAERLFGIRRAEAMGKRRRELFRPQDRVIGLPDDQLAIAERQGSFSDTGWRVKSDGSAVRVHSSMTRLAPDGITRGFVEEVTTDNETLSRQRAEASLHEQRLQIRRKVTEAEERAVEYQRELAALTSALNEETERRRNAEAELQRFRAQTLPLIELEIPLEPGIDATRHGATEIDEDSIDWIETGELAVTDMIMEATRGARSGVLLLRSDVHRAEIYFDHGRIAATTSDDPRSRLGEWMVRHGLITDAARKQALEMCEFGEISFGRSLLTLKILTKEEILAAMGDKIESDVERCRKMTVTRWAFVSSATTRTLVPINVDPREMRAMQTVVAMPTSNRYHRSTCSLVSHVDGPPLLLSESAATERGLAPCRRCIMVA